MSACSQPDLAAQSTLQAYLLGSVDFDAFLQFQRRLHYEVTGNRPQSALILCEHPPLISVGRRGSRSHIRLEQEELRHRGWPIRWVHRGGGCVMHLPGQLAIYPILPLDRLGLSVGDYLRKLGETINDVLSDFSIRGPIRYTDEGVWIGDRLLAVIGVSVRDWVTCFGVYVNLHPPLDLYRLVSATPRQNAPMTSLERERRGRVRPALVRERVIEHFQRRFGFGKVALFTGHPALSGASERCREFSSTALS